MLSTAAFSDLVDERLSHARRVVADERVAELTEASTALIGTYHLFLANFTEPSMIALRRAFRRWRVACVAIKHIDPDFNCEPPI